MAVPTMATPPEAVAILQAPSIMNTADVRRAREFYRYIQPSNLVHPRNRRKGSTFDGRHDHVPSLSHMLSPFCQLTAVRCNAPKAMLNVMDRDMMYFLAEANIVPTASGELDFREDPIMMACSAVPVAGRICEMTLRLEKNTPLPGIPMFVVSDLTQSEYAHLSVVNGPPYYRFYAGTPITTRNGINVGSLAVMDTIPRECLTEAQEDFLGQTAAQIMAYLETNRQAIEGRRARHMAKGQEAFIAGKRTLEEEVGRMSPGRSFRQKQHSGYGLSSPLDESEEFFPEPDTMTPPKRRRSSSHSSREETNASEGTADGDDDDDTTLPTRISEPEPRSHSKTFARAANLLRESFDELGDDGVVMFVTRPGRLNGLLGSESTNFNSGSRRGSLDPTTISLLSSSASPTVKILACSSEEQPTNTNLEISSTPASLTEAFVKELTRRYPNGRLWSFDANGRLSSSEEDALDVWSPRMRSSRGSRWAKLEERSLLSAFPSARQLLFTPIWDPDIGSCAHGAFVCATLETRPMGTPELSFLNSFCSSVMAECSRLDTEQADKQKSDFVGVISHEMRSPLHGILASVEFLSDTELSGFQRSLIDTVDSCGRTLLDTINHVLDYSKVNSFQKHWQASNRRTNQVSWKKNQLGPDMSSRTIPHGAPPLLQLFGITDVGAVLEEVVDGLVFGDMYSSGVDITDVSREARGRAGSGSIDPQNGELAGPNVQVFIDVQHVDWVFLTQPGALRRIIMNITGNALKYTAQGSITVKLELKATTVTGAIDGSETLLLTVVDTGRGISQQFLSSRLFTPFAQENALAPGTGLGMSIVHSIVTMLGGTIDVWSEVGKGTTVSVSLPMRRPLPGQQSTATTPQSAGTVQSSTSNVDESISLLKQQASDFSVAVYGTHLRPGSKELSRIISKYVEEWYGLDIVHEKLLGFANVVITEEKDLDSLSQRLVGTPGSRPALVVICDMTSRHNISNISALEGRINGAVEFISRPCGPHKLAKGMRLALEKLRAIRPRFRKVAPLGVIPEQPSPLPAKFSRDSTHDSMTDGLQEMNLNSPGQSDSNMVVQASETFAASQSSHNAHMAITDPTPGPRSGATKDEGDAFPFPTQLQPPSEAKEPVGGARRLTNGNVHVEAQKLVKDEPILPSVVVPLVDPPILLVDDNKINLKLLETFLRNKRKYTNVHTAEDGQQALQAALNASVPFEIIFMDISMPVMNGFEATRAIREYEKLSPEHGGALIIALTGLASGRDQSEGFESGCDLYMTKPVSFKQVGKLLDNWEAHYRLQNESRLDVNILQDVVKAG